MCGAGWVHPVANGGDVVHGAATGSGGPAVPKGGRVAKRQEASPSVTDFIGTDTLAQIAKSQRSRPIELAWSGLLSLRDPTGAMHAVGPPEVSHCHN